MLTFTMHYLLGVLLLCVALASACSPGPEPAVTPEPPIIDEEVSVEESPDEAIEDDISSESEEAAPVDDHSAGTVAIPDGAVDGWTLDGAVALYTKDTISDYINGEAEAYHPYGFVACAAGDYIHAADNTRKITVDIYEMGSALDAFGIFSNYRNENSKPLDAGAGGIGSAHQNMFYMDKYFVRIKATGTEETRLADLAIFTKVVESRIPGEGVKPAGLALFEAEGINPISVKYIAESVMGYRFFKKGFTAEAKLDEKDIRVFVIVDSSPEEAKETIEAYAKYLKSDDAPCEITENADGPFELMLVGEDLLYKGIVLQVRGNLIFGAANLENPETTMPLLESMSQSGPTG